jgi:hypothetical protein
MISDPWKAARDLKQSCAACRRPIAAGETVRTHRAEGSVSWIQHVQCTRRPPVAITRRHA